MKHTSYLAILWTALVLGCGGGGGDSPSDKCETLIDDFCSRATACVADAAGMQDQCVHAAESTVSCGNVKSVTANFDSCIDLLNNQSCAALFPTDASGQAQVVLPEDCRGVLSTYAPGGSPRLTEAFTAAIRAAR